MNINELSTQMTFTPVPIFGIKQDSSVVSGTGFVFSIRDGEYTMPFLITNYHVLKGTTEGYINFHKADIAKGVPTDEMVSVRFENQAVENNRLGKLDLVAIPLAATLDSFQKKGLHFFLRSVEPNMIPTDEQWNELGAIEDITFIGYPNGLMDRGGRFPLVRRGITATPIWNDFNGEEQFLIDAGVFPGSSGSPVFVFNRGIYPDKDGMTVGNRLMFVGIISGTVTNNHTGYLNLGVVINSKAFYRELGLFIKRITKK